MLANSLDDGSLPSTVAACTNVTPLEPTTIAGMTNAELAECFSNAQRCNSHTQPLPSGPKAVKRFRLSLEDFDSSQLNPFLYGYLYQSGEIPDSVLDDILTVCVNSDAVWAGRCQQLAFNLVAKELEAKAAGMVPRDNEDDPIALPQLRNVLPTVVFSPPRIRMRTCSILFVGTLGESEEYIDQHYSASLLIQNKGKRPVSAVITQIKTLIDGVHTDDPLVEASLQDELPPEGSADMKFRVKKLQNLKFSEIQQLYVLTIDSVMRYFVSFTVIAPHRLFEPLKFPRCVAVRVERSPLPYEVPLVLQVLKHQLIRQRGLTSAAVAHLMMPNSVNFRLHNHEVIRQALELRNTMNINEDVMNVLHSFWNSIPEKHRTENMAFHRPPRALSEPPGFARGVDIPTGSSGCCVDYFPNAMTKLPEALLLAPAEVIMGMILLCLSDMDCCVFDTTVIHCDPVEYVSTISPATKGILIWILDLCCALLMNASANGLTVRALALTFTSVLVRHSPLQLLSGDKTRSFSTEVVLHQHAVTALITWISLFMELHP